MQDMEPVTMNTVNLMIVASTIEWGKNAQGYLLLLDNRWWNDWNCCNSRIIAYQNYRHDRNVR